MNYSDAQGTVGHRSHDPRFHKKYMEAGVMTFVALTVPASFAVMLGLLIFIMK